MMEVRPDIIHGEFIDPDFNRPARVPERLGEVAAGPVASPDAPIDVNDMTISEEGVYAPPRPHTVLDSEVVEFRTAALPRRRPRIAGDDSFLAAIGDE
jgi:hypothetical protein